MGDTKVVVFGGGGFIGSHTADRLSDLGYQVTIFDREVSPWLRNDQSMVVGDLLDRELVEKTIVGAEYIYHFAGVADIRKATERPYDAININVMGTTVLLEAAVKEKIERFVFASTMYVYSSYGSVYRASKQAAETIVEVYRERFGLNYTFLRYGSLYGPRSQDWNGLKSYVKKIVENKALNYKGTGSELREYIHVIDAARLSVQVLDAAHKNEAIIVTGSQAISSAELIEMIFEISNCEHNVQFAGAGSNEGHYVSTPYRYTPKKAKKLVPSEFVDLGQGILDLVEEIYQSTGS